MPALQAASPTVSASPTWKHPPGLRHPQEYLRQGVRRYDVKTFHLP